MLFMLEVWNGWTDDDAETKAAGVAQGEYADAVKMAKSLLNDNRGAELSRLFGLSVGYNTRQVEVFIYSVTPNKLGREYVGTVTPLTI